MSEGGGIARDITRIEAPYRRDVLLQDVQHESGMRMLRMRIREGRRFTIIDIDEATAKKWADVMMKWAHKELPDDGSNTAAD